MAVAGKDVSWEFKNVVTIFFWSCCCSVGVLCNMAVKNLHVHMYLFLFGKLTKVFVGKTGIKLPQKV